MKTHLAITSRTGVASACGRGARMDTSVSRTTCLNCQAKLEYTKGREDALAAQEAAFQAQTPRTIVPQFGRVNDDGIMECPKCTGVLFRERPRSLFSYHYVCEGCGFSVHPMTETGMCT